MRVCVFGLGAVGGLVAARLGRAVGPRTVIVPAMHGVPWWFFHELGTDVRLESTELGRAVGAPTPSIDALPGLGRLNVQVRGLYLAG
ncbi:MAG: hypothetical protein ACRDNL_04105 [Spirillospora sp.]